MAIFYNCPICMFHSKLHVYVLPIVTLNVNSYMSC